MSRNRKNRKKGGRSALSSAIILVLVALVCLLGLTVYQRLDHDGQPDSDGELSHSPGATGYPEGEAPTTLDPETGEPLPDPGQAPRELFEYEPHSVDSTDPYRLLTGTGVRVNGEDMDSYQLEEGIDFGFGEDYTRLEGVITFRGNNFRDTASYGYANLSEELFGYNWTVSTGSLTAPSGAYWSGNGWTGQPLIVKWPKSTRAVMNMYDWAREKDELVEVIYAAMDGNIYFMELESGSKTRDTLTLGYTFKGAGALDPRGYPILYLGAGYDSYKGTSRAFIISLVDGSVMYEFGNNDNYSLRGSLSYFDSSALVDAETDQLIYPGENGILYIIKLNSEYDESAGTVSVNPSTMVKWRYNGKRTGGAYWLGMEDSAVIWRGHIIMADNGGNLMCLNLNTLKIVWVQDVLDDTNCSPVLELEDGHPYIYISTSFHAGWRAPEGATAEIPIWKIDAVTGEIVWDYSYDCHTVTDTSGGVQGTLALGKNALSDLIYVPVARTPGPSTGVLACLNKRTGQLVWEKQTQLYSWSSPVLIYNEDGKGYVIFCNAAGYMYLFDGLTGDLLDSLSLGSNIEASPAVYENIAVVGTRENGIWGTFIK